MCVALRYTSRLARTRTKFDSYENRHKIVIWKPTGRKTTSRLDHKNKMTLKKGFGVCRVDWLALGQGPVVVFCE